MSFWEQRTWILYAAINPVIECYIFFFNPVCYSFILLIIQTKGMGVLGLFVSIESLFFLHC